MVYLASSGEISAACMCPDDYQSLPGFGSEEVEITTAPKDRLGVGGNTDMCDEGCFMYKELTYSTNTKYAGL